jgi:hypothetical protein
MENKQEEKEISNASPTATKLEEQPKSENPQPIPLKTEMCQLIYYDFTVK